MMMLNTKYFTHTNYFWTFCEGLYLHTMVQFAFVNEKFLIYSLVFIGWISPLIYVIPYIVLRSLSSNTEKYVRLANLNQLI